MSDMRIAFVPIDNRPVCYSLAKDICAMDEEIILYLPPRHLLGDLTKTADIEKIFEWMSELPETDVMILSLDTICYGGLIPSRRGKETLAELKERLERLKPLILNKKVYAFSSIMRISNNNYNEEEKEYWKDWGEKIFAWSFSGVNDGIPEEIIKDYLETRKRNFEINKIYLEWQKEGILDTLIFSKDDCAEKGLNVEEARELERLGGMTKTGADEIPLTLLSRAIDKEIKVYPEFLETEYKDCISNYEDVSIEKSVLGQLELGGFKVAESKSSADIILVVNNFIKKQGELVMGWETTPFSGEFKTPDKYYCAADVRYANGADNNFVEELLKNIDLGKFFGYAGWNTSANTLGSLLACVKVKWGAKKYNHKAFQKLQMIRFLDDWGYPANIRAQINSPCNITRQMKFYEEKLSQIFDYKINAEYTYPWNRKFEIEVKLT